MALVTVDDVLKYMDIDFSNTQEAAAQFVLDGLHAELEAYLRRPLEETTYTEEEYRIPFDASGLASNSIFWDSSLDTTGSGLSYAYSPPYTLALRHSPIVSVSAVTRTAATASPTETTLTANVDYVVQRFGLDLYEYNPDDLIKVTYVAGLDGPNIPMMKLLILRAATREMQNMHDDVMGIKDLTAEGVALEETGFLESELESVKRWRRVRVA